MKIAIPVDNKSLDSNVSASFGRSSYFLIYDTESKESSFIENTAVHSSGGAGIKAAQTVADSGAKAVLTPRCGQNAAEVLKAAGIELYKTVAGNAEENIAAFSDKKLSALDDIHAGFRGRGGGR